MEEIWKDIPGFEGLYQVSNFGRIKSLNYRKTGKEHILKFGKNPKGYSRTTLFKNGETRYYLTHRLVAQAFIPNPDNLPEINHKNEIKTDNRVENLEWCTNQYNINYGTRNKRRSETLTNGACSKPVAQYTIDGEFIKEWPSMQEVERQTGYLHQNISKCCMGKYKTSHNYVWKYL